MNSDTRSLFPHCTIWHDSPPDTPIVCLHSISTRSSISSGWPRRTYDKNFTRFFIFSNKKLYIYIYIHLFVNYNWHHNSIDGILHKYVLTPDQDAQIDKNIQYLGGMSANVVCLRSHPNFSYFSLACMLYV